jgi:divalent metal cation (Fe/Co/Zn/Cd) transporter
VAAAKSVAAAITGSASLVAEAAHSWADTGNELFLVTANRRSVRPPDPAHPLGYGREAYVWSLFAALGLFVAGGAASITHGVSELRSPSPADSFLVGYLVLAVSFVLEGTSLLRSVRQARAEAQVLQRDLIEHVVNSNRRFLVGEEADPRVRGAVLEALHDLPEVARVTYLRLEIVGPRSIAITGDVDLTGDETESNVAVRLRALEARMMSSSPAVVGARLSLSAPDEPTLTA